MDADFDNAAKTYDSTFTHTAVGKAQRAQVWRLLQQIPLTRATRVLEINCGTGEDAQRFYEKGCTVLATDLSAGMIQEARRKFPQVHFEQKDLLAVHELLFQPHLLFSNFGGLNCLSPEQLNIFLNTCFGNRIDHQRLVFVVMGKKCVWDRFFLLLKGKWRKIGRRNTHLPVTVHVDGSLVNTWYYSPKDLLRLCENNYRMEFCKPIGFFVPPSYLAPFFQHRKRLLRCLNWLDQHATFSKLSNYADHFILSLVPHDSSHH